MAWCIGRSVGLDISGSRVQLGPFPTLCSDRIPLAAEAVGIPAVLVRDASGKARRHCLSLLELVDEIEQIHA
jgi:hypothetical protein